MEYKTLGVAALGAVVGYLLTSKIVNSEKDIYERMAIGYALDAIDSESIDGQYPRLARN